MTPVSTRDAPAWHVALFTAQPAIPRSGIWRTTGSSEPARWLT